MPGFIDLKTLRRVGNSFLKINLCSTYSYDLNMIAPTSFKDKVRADVMSIRSGSLKLGDIGVFI